MAESSLSHKVWGGGSGEGTETCHLSLGCLLGGVEPSELGDQETEPIMSLTKADEERINTEYKCSFP